MIFLIHHCARPLPKTSIERRWIDFSLTQIENEEPDAAKKNRYLTLLTGRIKIYTYISLKEFFMVQKSITWLREDVCPLWLKNGFDTQAGAFEECLALDGKPISAPRRLMVQSRQIFSFRLAMELGACDRQEALRTTKETITGILKNYSLPSGAFAHSISKSGEIVDQTPDLYAQAFALFGLANAYAIEPLAVYEDRAFRLVDYLNESRKVEGGGYLEIGKNGMLFQSNPHMHLFEAFISWMEVSSNSKWQKNASEILNLCLEKFIDRPTHLLAEHFNSNWNIERENGRFFFEPGHQYEWAWLMGKYERLTDTNLRDVRNNLVEKSELYGVDSDRMCVYDEVWSDHTPKSKTARFWPQTERIKAVLQLAEEATTNSYQIKMTSAADEAISTLFKFFECDTKGLWFDRMMEDGSFQKNPAKASSLYHIIAALNDYIKIRPKMKS